MEGLPGVGIYFSGKLLAMNLEMTSKTASCHVHCTDTRRDSY